MIYNCSYHNPSPWGNVGQLCRLSHENLHQFQVMFSVWIDNYVIDAKHIGSNGNLYPPPKSWGYIVVLMMKFFSLAWRSIWRNFDWRSMWFQCIFREPKKYLKALDLGPVVNHEDWYRNYLLSIDTTLWDNVCQWLAADQLFSLGTLVSSTNKTDCYNIAKILLKVALNTITPNPLLCIHLPFHLSISHC